MFCPNIFNKIVVCHFPVGLRLSKWGPQTQYAQGPLYDFRNPSNAGYTTSACI